MLIFGLKYIFWGNISYYRNKMKLFSKILQLQEKALQMGTIILILIESQKSLVFCKNAASLQEASNDNKGISLTANKGGDSCNYELGLTLYFSHCFLEILHCNCGKRACLLFLHRLFPFICSKKCLLASSTFYTADKRKSVQNK